MNKITIYCVRGKKIRLHTLDKVFSPSTFPYSLSKFFARNIKIKKGETVFDAGFGTGFLAILAAKLGAKKILGSETNKAAIALAKKNAKLNKVKFRPLKGPYFAGTKEKFDVIIGNMPQGISPKQMPERERKLFDLSKTKGNKILLEFLRQAKTRLKRRGRIYCAICYLQDYKQTLKEIEKTYSMKKIKRRKCPLPNWLESKHKGSKAFYNRLYKAGKIKLIDELFELRLKNDN